MSEFKFGNAFYPNADAMHDAMTVAWVGAGDEPTIEDVRKIRTSFTGKVLLLESVAGWNLKSKKHSVPGYDRGLLREALERLHDKLETEEVNNWLSDNVGDEFHIADGPCNGHGYRIGKYEDPSHTSFVYVGEVRHLMYLPDWLENRG